MSRSRYTAIILRYVHDLVSGEFVNAGLLLLCPQHGYVHFQALPRTRRILQFFPGTNARTIKAALTSAKRSAQSLTDLLSEFKPNEQDAHSIIKVAHRIVPHDDSGLQWSAPSDGLTSDPEITFHRLFERLVMRYEDDQPKPRRTDEQVWRSFSKALEKRNVSALIQEHEIEGKLESLTFKHALKNGIWHLLEPVSFDLASPESIKDKAKKLLGEMTLLREGREDFVLYFLVGQPAADSAMEAYESALQILAEVPLQKMIYMESQAEQLATDLAKITVTH